MRKKLDSRKKTRGKCIIITSTKLNVVDGVGRLLLPSLTEGERLALPPE